jgi:hypothetical protein
MRKENHNCKSNDDAGRTNPIILWCVIIVLLVPLKSIYNTLSMTRALSMRVVSNQI